jgi:starch synthase (maltosyl-transferring)
MFIAENLGGMMEQVEGLRSAGFDYLFNSSKWWDFRQGWLLEQYERFRSIAPSISFPETHDTERLAADLAERGITTPRDVERRYRQAYVFAAVFSTGVMIPMGFEFGFKKRLHVVSTRATDWETPAFDLTRFIGDVNKLKASVPVLNEEGPQRAIHLGDGRILCLLRRAMRGSTWSVVIVNTDPGAPVTARIEGLDGDVRGGREITPGWQGLPLYPGTEITLEPSDIRVFATN